MVRKIKFTSFSVWLVCSFAHITVVFSVVIKQDCVSQVKLVAETNCSSRERWRRLTGRHLFVQC